MCFKPGDRVICIRPSLYVESGTHIIDSIIIINSEPYVVLTGNAAKHFTSRFILATPLLEELF
jgi:hypothetical protein